MSTPYSHFQTGRCELWGGCRGSQRLQVLEEALINNPYHSLEICKEFMNLIREDDEFYRKNWEEVALTNRDRTDKLSPRYVEDLQVFLRCNGWYIAVSRMGTLLT